MGQGNKMLVSFCVIAYNEEKYLGSLFQDILNQDYDHKHIEVVLVDSMSTDTTKAMMNEFAKKYENEFFGIKVADNPKKKQSSGWNTAIPMASGDIIIRVDAHSKVTENFVSNNVRCMDSGEDICGDHSDRSLDHRFIFRRSHTAGKDCCVVMLGELSVGFVELDFILTMLIYTGF